MFETVPKLHAMATSVPAKERSMCDALSRFAEDYSEARQDYLEPCCFLGRCPHLHSSDVCRAHCRRRHDCVSCLETNLFRETCLKSVAGPRTVPADPKL